MYFSTGSKRLQRKIDFWLCISTFVLVIFGIIMVYSATFYRYDLYGISKFRAFFKEILRLAIGIMAFLIGRSIDPKNYRKYIKYAMYVIIGILGLVFIVGLQSRGATRWLKVGLLTFQPSEVAKIVIILYLANELYEERSALKNPIKLLKVLALPFIAILLTAIQPNYSMALIIAIIVFGMLFFAGVKITNLLIPVLFSVLLLLMLYVAVPQKFTHVEKRIKTFVSGEKHYQVKQSLIAISEGRVVGKGIGKSTEKYLYLPMAENDFIFAIICEELGFLGAFIIIMGYIIIILRGFNAASRHFRANYYYSLVAIGITLMIFVVSAVHIGVNLGLFPPTGQALPLISMGGSSLLVNLFGLGILSHISEKVEDYESIR